MAHYMIKLHAGFRAQPLHLEVRTERSLDGLPATVSMLVIHSDTHQPMRLVPVRASVKPGL
ncbi:hypothetical protein AWC19_08210 [Mycobacterium palustre]|uniref:Uncharacterized protein n=1 Tax=Mycobacterium palustre TaxID=153971 RepID=A0A1X1ZPZ4_9MYCO|nr:hypothetical protein AWC19_08210 [Mycobacterium palustre]